MNSSNRVIGVVGECVRRCSSIIFIRVIVSFSFSQAPLVHSLCDEQDYKLSGSWLNNGESENLWGQGQVVSRLSEVL